MDIVDGNGFSNNNDILDKEIESWKGYEYALQEENAILFNKMLSEAKQYAKAINAKGELFSAEALFMALIFQQQKMIGQLIDKISKEGLEQEEQQASSNILKEYGER